MKTEKVLISKILIFIVSFVSILCGLFFIISHKTLAAEIITNVDDNSNSYTFTIFDPNLNRNVNIAVKWIKTDLRPELVPAKYFNSSNLTAHEEPNELIYRTNATIAINGGCWYVTGENVDKPWGTTGINGTCYSALYDPVSGQDVTDLTKQTLVINSSGQLDAIEINSAEEYVTKYQEGKADWAVYGKYTIIDDGSICNSDLPVDHAPRSFIAQDYNGYYYIGVTESKDSSVLYTGPSYTELANFIINNISSNIRFAYALDGGGSSALYDQDTRANIVIESSGERAVSNCICFYATGWLKKGDYWYYYNSNHQTETGWKLINSKWYYLSPANGAMVTGWQLINNKWYYLSESGAMLTGWQKINNKWYYLSDSGAMQTGWQKINNKWYYLSDSGAMQIGWQKIDNKWYYFNDSGAMQTGWQLINNKWYYFNDSGAMQTGFKLIDNIWYYFNSEGVYSSAYNSIVYGYVSGTYAWWYVVNGKVSFNSTPTVAENENGWWYVHYGYVDFEFTGIAHNSYGYWYCENGQVQFGYSGWIYYKGDAWYVREGSATQMG